MCARLSRVGIKGGKMLGFNKRNEIKSNVSLEILNYKPFMCSEMW